MYFQRNWLLYRDFGGMFSLDITRQRLSGKLIRYKLIFIFSRFIRLWLDWEEIRIVIEENGLNRLMLLENPMKDRKDLNERIFEINFCMILFHGNMFGNFIQVQHVPLIQEDKHVITSTFCEVSCQ